MKNDVPPGDGTAGAEQSETVFAGWESYGSRRFAACILSPGPLNKKCGNLGLKKKSFVKRRIKINASGTKKAFKIIYRCYGIPLRVCSQVEGWHLIFCLAMRICRKHLQSR